MVLPRQSSPDDGNRYAAPELAGMIGHPAAPDISSLGVILWEMFPVGARHFRRPC
jgi:hypothetical protein